MGIPRAAEHSDPKVRSVHVSASTLDCCTRTHKKLFLCLFMFVMCFPHITGGTMLRGPSQTKPRAGPMSPGSEKGT